MTAELPPGPSGRLLIVADPPVLGQLRELLRAEGYAVAGASSPAEALEMLAGQQFAAVLAEQQVTTSSGLELLVQAGIRQPLAKRILLTGGLSLSAARDAVNKAGIFRLVIKPWQGEDLLRLVREALESYNAASREHWLLTTTLAKNDVLNRQNQALTKQLAQGGSG